MDKIGEIIEVKEKTCQCASDSVPELRAPTPWTFPGIAFWTSAWPTTSLLRISRDNENTSNGTILGPVAYATVRSRIPPRGHAARERVLQTSVRQRESLPTHAYTYKQAKEHLQYLQQPMIRFDLPVLRLRCGTPRDVHLGNFLLVQEVASPSFRRQAYLHNKQLPAGERVPYNNIKIVKTNSSDNTINTKNTLNHVEHSSICIFRKLTIL